MNTEERLELMEHQLAEILHLLKPKPDKVNRIQQSEADFAIDPNDIPFINALLQRINERNSEGDSLSIAEGDEEYDISQQSELWRDKHENEISHAIIGCAIEVHKELGPGLLESAYEEALCYELSEAGLLFGRQQRVPIRYKKVILATPLKLDLIVEGKIIVDNKAKQTVTPIDKQALLTYLRLRKVHLGLIINFHELKLVDGVQRIVNNLTE
ncbi:GxxExxY protein [Novipirellula sp. SH528]|uniref:GxxExxY protein n=1 Tax=Novipirellula sp. SH528 TaxID=3454466 RepID=UPI003F9F528A